MGTTLANDAEIELTASRLKAIAHPYRLATVCLLAEGERSVNEICEALGTSQPNISQHLRILSNQQLLTSRKEANRVFYAVADTRLLQIIEMLRTTYCA